MTREGFKELDTNNNKSLSYDEIKAGLEELAKSQNHTITKDEWEWIKETGEKIDSKTPGKVDEHEFFLFANAVFEHFGLCHLVDEDDHEDHGDHNCDMSPEDSAKVFADVDTNHNGFVGWKEVKTALTAVAKERGHTITKANKKWVRKHFKKQNDGKKGGKGLDEKEFNVFAN